jgi:hypothetical protein
MSDPRPRLPLVGMVNWSEDPLIGKTEPQNQNKTKPSYEEKTKTPIREALRGLPLVGTEDSAKSSQKGALEAGRFAPAPRLILYEK